jgi:hypothetical protein
VRKLKEVIGEIVGIGFMLSVVLSPYILIGLLVFRFRNNIWTYIVLAAPVAVVVGALAVALSLYLLRSVARVHYGLLEVTFGAVSIAATAAAVDVTATSILQIAGGIYIVVRGLIILKLGWISNLTIDYGRCGTHFIPRSEWSG